LKPTAGSKAKKVWEKKMKGIEKHTCFLVPAGNELFIVFDGKRIAKRGRPGTRDAKMWVSLDRGWEVVYLPDGDLEVRMNGTLMTH
jgi:hypothetical protein